MATEIAIYQCPVHDMETLSFERSGGSGVRMLGGKCCVRQYERTLARWRVSGRQWEEIIEEAAALAEMANQEERNGC